MNITKKISFVYTRKKLNTRDYEPVAVMVASFSVFLTATFFT